MFIDTREMRQRDVQFAMVERDGLSIKYIDNPSTEVIEIAKSNINLNNYTRNITINPDDSIKIGCMTKHLDAWLSFDASEYEHPIIAGRIKELLKEYFNTSSK